MTTRQMEIAFRASHMSTAALKIEGVRLAASPSREDRDAAHLMEAEYRRRAGGPR